MLAKTSTKEKKKKKKKTNQPAPQFYKERQNGIMRMTENNREERSCAAQGA